MKDRKFYSGSTLDQALMKASRDLGVPKESLRYRQIDKKHGFLKMRRSIVIEVDPSRPAGDAAPTSASAHEESTGSIPWSPGAGASGLASGGPATTAAGIEEPREAEGAPPAGSAPRESAPRAPRRESTRGGRGRGEAGPETPQAQGESDRPRRERQRPNRGGMVELPQRRSAAEKYPQATGEVADAIREALGMLLDLAGVDMESSIHQGEERYEIDLWGADQEILLRDDGRPLLSLQHLLVRLVRGMTGESIYCRVDCDQFHEIREERLRDLAQRVAREVADQHRSRLLESMAPDERRIVHLTLADDPHVDTESQGDGYFKRVKIFPV